MVCDGKVGYATSGEAKAALRRVQEQKSGKGRHRTRRAERGLNAYQCPECSRWHLGRR